MIMNPFGCCKSKSLSDPSRNLYIRIGYSYLVCGTSILVSVLSAMMDDGSGFHPEPTPALAVLCARTRSTSRVYFLGPYSWQSHVAHVLRLL